MEFGDEDPRPWYPLDGRKGAGRALRLAFIAARPWRNRLAYTDRDTLAVLATLDESRERGIAFRLVARSPLVRSEDGTRALMWAIFGKPKDEGEVIRVYHRLALWRESGVCQGEECPVLMKRLKRGW